jgi:23S rRNA pseudouridine1911/1915/1917 synthase
MVKRSKENGQPDGREAPVLPRLARSARSGPLDGAVREAFGVSWGKARDLVRTGKISVGGEVITDPLARVDEGDELHFDPAARRADRKAQAGRGAGLSDDAIVFVDAHVVVVRKAPGISTVPYEGDERGTLDELVRTWLGRQARSDRRGPAPLGVVHRIDKETSGLVVFTRTWLAKQSLAAQFRAHTVHRRYLAIAHGVVRAATCDTWLIENRGDGLRGSFKGKNPPPAARRAITHVEPLEALSGATLVRCRLETGRTHQIRIHLSERGHPIVGEQVYVRDARRMGLTLIPAPRLLLHAAELGFEHPKTGQPVHFEEPMPSDMMRIRERLAIAR